MRRWRWSSTPARTRKRRRDKSAKLDLGRFKNVDCHSRSLNGIRRVTLAQQQTARDLLLSSFCPFAALSFVVPDEHSETRGLLAYPQSPRLDARRVDPGSQACPGLDPGPGRRRERGNAPANINPLAGPPLLRLPRTPEWASRGHHPAPARRPGQASGVRPGDPHRYPGASRWASGMDCRGPRGKPEDRQVRQ